MCDVWMLSSSFYWKVEWELKMENLGSCSPNVIQTCLTGRRHNAWVSQGPAALWSSFTAVSIFKSQPEHGKFTALWTPFSPVWHPASSSVWTSVRKINLNFPLRPHRNGGPQSDDTEDWIGPSRCWHHNVIVGFYLWEKVWSLWRSAVELLIPVVLQIRDLVVLVVPQVWAVTDLLRWRRRCSYHLLRQSSIKYFKENTWRPEASQKLLCLGFPVFFQPHDAI